MNYPTRPLSRREAEVLALTALGLSNGSIAGRLHLTANTVKTHLKRIQEVLGTADRAASVTAAVTLGVLVATYGRDGLQVVPAELVPELAVAA